MVNSQIRKRATGTGVKLWEIAHALGITDSSLSRKLRLELPDDEQKRILNIIDDIQRRHADEAV